MQVQKSTRQLATEAAPTVRKSALNMYSEPPDSRLSLTEFEDFAFDRLRREKEHAQPMLPPGRHTLAAAAPRWPAPCHLLPSDELPRASF